MTYLATYATQYRIEYSTFSGGPWGLSTVTSNTAYLPHLGSQPLYFRIRGENPVGEGGPWVTFYVTGQCGGPGGGGGID